jgi:hypothetical protein
LNQTGKSYYGDIFTSKPDPKDKKADIEKQKKTLKKTVTLSGDGWSETEKKAG